MQVEHGLPLSQRTLRRLQKVQTEVLRCRLRGWDMTEYTFVEGAKMYSGARLMKSPAYRVEAGSGKVFWWKSGLTG